MKVTSSTVSVQVYGEAELTIAVSPNTGYLGDTFHFLGTLYYKGGGGPIEGARVTLYRDGVSVGSTTTDSYGNWSIDWVADAVGILEFYAEAVF